MKKNFLIFTITLIILSSILFYGNNHLKFKENKVYTYENTVKSENNINKWIEKPLNDDEKENCEYILLNTVTGEEVTDVYESENGVIKKLNVKEALTKFNNYDIYP